MWHFIDKEREREEWRGEREARRGERGERPKYGTANNILV